MQIVFDPDKSSLEEKTVSYRGKGMKFERNKPVPCNDELSKLLLAEPNNFKAVNN